MSRRELRYRLFFLQASLYHTHARFPWCTLAHCLAKTTHTKLTKAAGTEERDGVAGGNTELSRLPGSPSLPQGLDSLIVVSVKWNTVCIPKGGELRSDALSCSVAPRQSSRSVLLAAVLHHYNTQFHRKHWSDKHSGGHLGCSVLAGAVASTRVAV